MTDTQRLAAQAEGLCARLDDLQREAFLRTDSRYYKIRRVRNKALARAVRRLRHLNPAPTTQQRYSHR